MSANSLEGLRTGRPSQNVNALQKHAKPRYWWGLQHSNAHKSS